MLLVNIFDVLGVYPITLHFSYITGFEIGVFVMNIQK